MLGNTHEDNHERTSRAVRLVDRLGHLLGDVNDFLACGLFKIAAYLVYPVKKFRDSLAHELRPPKG
jgi:hypothetical protein